MLQEKNCNFLELEDLMRNYKKFFVTFFAVKNVMDIFMDTGKNLRNTSM